MVILKAVNRGPPSQLLMPFVFAAHAGSLLTMTGSPVNVMMSDVTADTLAKTLFDQYAIGSSVPTADALFTPERGVVEVVIPPRSRLIGEPVHPGMMSDNGEFVILAMHRHGENITKEVALDVGDLLLLVMVGLVATNALPEAVTGLLVAGAMIVTRALTLEQAYKAVSWTTVILVAAMIPLATAMRDTGAAEILATTLVQIVGDAGPYALLIGLFVLTAGLGQLISNMATALVVSPIAVSAATTLGVSARPLLMAVTVAAAAAFLTPVATPVNLMIKEPGGYQFSDYWKLGLPLLCLHFVLTLGIVPLVWRF